MLLTFTLHSQASTGVSPQVHATTVTKVPQQASVVTPVASQASTNKKMGPLQPTVTPVHTIVVATPTLIASTPQQTQFGVFALSSGGPLPVPESILHPTKYCAGDAWLNTCFYICWLNVKQPTSRYSLCLTRRYYDGSVTPTSVSGTSNGRCINNSLGPEKRTESHEYEDARFLDLNTNTFQW